MTQDTRKQGGSDQKKPREEADRDYQESLDEAIEESFPASDPISPSVPGEDDRVNPGAPHHKTGTQKK
jgi:hypothetical protein